jgi:hypothetical protein
LAGTILFAAACLAADSKPPFHYVYYLFLQPPFQGCLDCYIPMVITREPIRASALSKRSDIENVVIITYERDSIWEVRSDSIPLNAASVFPQERQLRWKDSRYRYQEVDKHEAIRLLPNPLGSIPISRVHPPVQEQERRLRALISDLSMDP